jgi:predicted O-methyltransferase YrrM
MPIAGKLVELYRAEGIDICTGLAPPRFGGLAEAAFTWFVRDGRSITNGLGIALQEIYLLEHLFAAFQPRRALVIGNSQGWSTLALALLLPQSRVVAIDSGFDENSLAGLDLTNRIAARAGLSVHAVKGVSPRDVAALVDGELGGTVDFAFVDGLHTCAQIVADYTAIAAKAAPDAVYLFHDVHQFDLYSGLAEIERMAHGRALTLAGTPSGVAILHDPARHPALAAGLAAFAPTPAAQAVVEHAAWRRQHRRRLKYRRSLRKRTNTVLGLLGRAPLPLDD